MYKCRLLCLFKRLSSEFQKCFKIEIALYYWLRHIYVITLLAAFSPSVFASVKSADTTFLPSSIKTSDIIGSPLFLNPVSGKPSVVIVLDRSARMFEHVYDLKKFDVDSVDGRLGYFQENVQYRYDRPKKLFVADSQLSPNDVGAWNGRFLNWLTLRRVDLAMLLLRGDQSSQKYKNATGSSKSLVTVSIANSADYSPIPNNQTITIFKDHFKVDGLTVARFNIGGIIKEKTQIKQEGLIKQLRERVNLYLFEPDSARLVPENKLEYSINQYFVKTDDESFLDSYTKISRLLGAKKSPVSLNANPYYDARQQQELSCKRVMVLHFSAIKQAPIKAQNYEQDCKVQLAGKQLLEPFQLVLALREKGGESDLAAEYLYWADQSEELEASLLLDSRMPKSAIGMPGEIKTGATLGSGMLVQASYFPEKKDRHEYVHWVGEIGALMTDRQGRVRSDNGDRKIGAVSVDPIVDTCFQKKEKQFRVSFSISEQERPSLRDAEMCSELIYTKSQEDIGYLWQAGKILSQSPYFDVSKQRKYSSSDTSKRYIRTHMNNNELGFLPDMFSKSTMGLLNTTDFENVARIVNFIRGEDQLTMRSRKFRGQTERLGDFINSQPIVVAQPSENYHLLYGDSSYLAFYRQYRDRRRIVYIGGNDGLLHAFNAGWFDEGSQQHITEKPDHASWLLGQEVWAFVPFNLLPHLKYLSKKEYGESVSDHLFLVDQTPYVFDAQIFGNAQLKGQEDRDFVDSHGVKVNDVTHPNGWGTIMVVGFGRGGSESQVFKDPMAKNTRAKDNVMSIRPSYLIFDITDPEQAPRLLTEFSHPKLLSSRAVPTVITTKAEGGELSWQLLLGSGPNIQVTKSSQLYSDQNAHLLMLDLKTMRLNKKFGDQGVLKLNEERAYIGGLAVADFDLDALSDAVYFGTISTPSSASNSGSELARQEMGGKLLSLRINNNSKSSSGRFYSQVLFDAHRPVLQSPLISTDKSANRWLHFGTGSIQTVSDLIAQSDDSLYGIKEPRFVSGDFKMDHHIAHETIQLKDLVDVSRAEVDEHSGSLRGISIKPALENDHVVDLDKRLRSHDDMSAFHSGWFKSLTSSESSVGKSTLLGGLYFQNTYKPDRKNCRLGGGFSQYRLKHTTGTAWFNARKQEYEQARPETLKDGLRTARPLESLLHLGELRPTRQMSMLNLSADGPIYTDQISAENISSQIVGWREL